MTEVKEFQCLKCGDCCKDTLSVNKNIGTGFFSEYMYLHTAPSLPIFDWEKPNLETRFQTKGVNIVPSTLIYDLNSKTSIVIQYTTDMTLCPHLTESNDCLIYKHRPITCKIFPLKIGILKEIADNIFGFDMGKCRFDYSLEEFNEKIIDETNEPQFLLNLYIRYKDAFKFALFGEFYDLFCNIKLDEFIQSGIIKPFTASGIEKKFRTKIRKSKSIGISEFIQETLDVTEKEILDYADMMTENLINDIKSN
ncbi:flagellin N-methylase [archaeon BMS3Abin16]|nr:flagellin N-methylase [archaeon BMS3Abin16]